LWTTDLNRREAIDETPYKAPQADTVGRGPFRIGKPLLVLAAIAAAWFFARFIQVAEMARQTSHLQAPSIFD
jgi:hypothetical protein